MAKDACELDLLRGRELLVAKEDDFVAGQRVLQLGFGHVAQGLGQVQPMDGGANGEGVGLDRKAGVGLGQIVEFGHLVFLSKLT